MKADDLQSLRIKAFEYGILLSQDQLELFRIYLEELWAWNRRMNLTGLNTREGIVHELFLDSLIPAPLLPRQGRMLDVGTGAGIPGLALKVFSPRLKIHLLEANSKKVSFLKHVIRLLGLEEIEVIRGRIERGGEHLDPLGYDIVTARALAALEQTISWCAPFVAKKGLFVGYLGLHGDRDIKESGQVLERHGLTLYRVTPYSLPGKRSKRISLILRKGA